MYDVARAYRIAGNAVRSKRLNFSTLPDEFGRDEIEGGCARTTRCTKGRVHSMATATDHGSVGDETGSRRARHRDDRAGLAQRQADNLTTSCFGVHNWATDVAGWRCGVQTGDRKKLLVVRPCTYLEHRFVRDLDRLHLLGVT